MRDISLKDDPGPEEAGVAKEATVALTYKSQRGGELSLTPLPTPPPHLCALANPSSASKIEHSINNRGPRSAPEALAVYL